MRIPFGIFLVLAFASSPAMAMVVDSYSGVLAGGGASITPTGLLIFDVGGGNHPGLVPVAPLLNEVSVSVTDAGTSFDFTSGALFDIASGVLTNGVNDPIVVEFDGRGIIASETFFFGTTPDFEGRTISQISFILDDVVIDIPGRNPNGNGIWSDVSLNYTIAVHSTATAVPEPSSFLTFLVLALLGSFYAFRRKNIQRRDHIS